MVGFMVDLHEGSCVCNQIRQAACLPLIVCSGSVFGQGERARQTVEPRTVEARIVESLRCGKVTPVCYRFASPLRPIMPEPVG